MPVLPPIAAQNYDSVNLVLTSARARLNDRLDTLAPVGGRLLANNQASTLQSLNSGWRKMQDSLADRGYAALIGECVVAGLPVVASLETSTLTWLSWQGFFDGANFFPDIQLPADFTHPIKIWERWSNQNAAFCDPGMEKVLDGLPMTQKTSGNLYWEWRGDAIWMPGSQMLMDLRIRYVRYLADFADAGDTQWFNQPVPIMRASDPLSWFLCAEVVAARGELEAAKVFLEKGESTLAHLFNLDVKADQRVNIQRRPRGRAGRRNWY